MFVRNVSLYLKPNTIAEFVQAMDSEIIPLLRKQKGFQDPPQQASAAKRLRSNALLGS
jgi:hypothetical protein